MTATHPTATTNLTPTLSRGPRRTGPLLRIAPAAATLGAILAGGAAVLALATGRGADDSAIFPPPWLGLVGAGLLGIALVLGWLSPGRSAQAASWTAAAVLLGASGGVVLDGFRAFFAVTGIPAGDFAEVDLPGAVARLSALGASFGAIQLARRARLDGGSAQRPVTARSRRIVRVLGLLLCLPYPLLKLVWWWQGEDSAYTVGFPAMEFALFGLAAVVLIGLTASRTPAVARVPLLVAGWGGAFAPLSMGALMVFGVLAQATGLATSPLTLGDPSRIILVAAVYGTWLLLGVVLAAATVLYGEARPARGVRGRSDETSRGAE
ncbi:hypothetical protein [Microlunatus sp. Y2014]|uniref:hypothetical protein n=1 Tax=Microlunatus sp. Y2014 TaxID=3418488 RepID=UPI003DA70398